MVEDHGDYALGFGSYNFGDVYSSIARPLFVFFDCFLGIAHLGVTNP